MEKNSESSTFLYPTFSEHIPDKINAKIEVKSPHALSIQSTPGWAPAIATNGFSSKTAGDYVFVTKIDNIAGGALMTGFTDSMTFPSSKNGYPGNGFSGACLNCFNGKVYPDDVDYLPAVVTSTAKEIICILTISPGVLFGFNYSIQWLIDGNRGPLRHLDCTKYFGKGGEIFPCIALGHSSQQVQTIPFQETTFTSPIIDKMMKECLNGRSNATIANNNSTTNQNKTSSSCGFTFAQLLHEFEKERQRANSLEVQLQQQNKEIARLTLQSQLINNNNNSLVPSSPFVKDKLYQIDFASNEITPPPDPNAFGTLLKLPSQNNSALFQHVKNELWKKLGSMIPSPAPVNHFTLESIDVIYSEVSTLESRMRRLQQLRTQNGNFFNPPTGAFTAEQLQTLIALRDQFLPRSSTADPKSPNLINVFHGTKVEKLDSVVHGLVAVRSTDAGYFGSGVYTTTSIEYAAKYARGDFDANNGPYPPRASDGCVPVVWCVAAVGVCYPLTREVDYSKKRIHDGMEVSDFFGMPLTAGYDCHCVAVNEGVGFQAVPRKDMQYMEVVFDQEFQVLPIAVLWVKPM